MNESLGTKQQCSECDAKFYDMDRFPVICPKCDYQFPDDDEMEIVIEFDLDDDESDDDDLDVEVDDEVMEGMSGGVAELVGLDEFEDEDVDHLTEVEDHQEPLDVDPNSDDAEDEMFLDDLADDDPHLIDDPDDLE